jgi:transposase
MAVDTLGHLLTLHVTAADVGDREAVARLAADIQNATGDTVSLAYVDQGYTGERAAEAAAAEGIALEVVKLLEAKRGFVLLPRRWVVERSFAWAELAQGSVGVADGMPAEGTRCRRLVKDYERYATTLAGFHVIAFIGYMLKQALILMQSA